ncbi:MAG: S8 family serine peptidase [Prevotella sp.]|uniref:S8 family serine peptidase n=1 Tax=Prevotella sp. TaxID=59823 RepID=UPI002A2CF9CC|nr:S8 family serine peptidase [Prevotella sp.]MDD7317618.1 S8 family serine peptidase [Prevotellaceae bacterium]MDY4020535.1 S8 family serine peptidase [Prevotella sp.]
MKRTLLSIFLAVVAVVAIAQSSALSKMSPMVRMAAMSYGKSVPAGSSKTAISGVYDDSGICAFVKITGDADALMSKYGCRSLATFGDIHIAHIPLASLQALACERGVERIEASPTRTEMLDKSATIIAADKLHSGAQLPQAFTGKGVVVGIQDIGFDLTNPNFYNTDQTQYRIKRFWDMLSTDTVGSELYVGADYTTEAEILAYKHSRDGLDNGHGTYTLGVLAGTGYGTPYRGMAYESDIVAVSNAVTSDTIFIRKEDLYKYTSATDALGFKYSLDYAEAQGKPCVVSFSEGSHQAQDDEEQLFYEVLRQMTGPGKIIVASAGNEGHYGTYIHKPVGKSGVGSFLKGNGRSAYLRLSADGDFGLRIKVYDTENGVESAEYKLSEVIASTDSLLKDTVRLHGADYMFTLGAYPNAFNGERVMVDVALEASAGQLGGDKPLSVQLTGEESDVELYRISGNLVGNASDMSLKDMEYSHTIYSPGSAPSVICVGATSYRTKYTNYRGEECGNVDTEEGVLAYYSGRGPTFDGRVKPDVVAPGSNIITTSNSFVYDVYPYPRSMVSVSEFRGRKYPWQATLGTSFSAPMVAGCIALWLQANPQLTTGEVMNIFSETCNRPDPTIDYPNNLYGYGEIDAYRGLLRILGINGIEGISEEQPSGVAFRLDGASMLHMDFASKTAATAALYIYNVSGSKLYEGRIEAGRESAEVSMASFPAGVYAVQLTSSDPAVCGSTLVRVGN